MDDKIYYHKISYYTKILAIPTDSVGVDYNLTTVKSIGGEDFLKHTHNYNLVVPGKTQRGHQVKIQFTI